MEKGQNPIKIVFLKVVIQKMREMKKWIFQKLLDTICVRKGLSVLAKNVFWTKTV